MAPRSFLSPVEFEALARITRLSATATNWDPDPRFWAISSPTTRQISPYEKLRGEVVFREHENIAHEPHQLCPRLDRQLGALGETGCERILDRACERNGLLT